MDNAEHINRLNEAIKEFRNIVMDNKAEELSRLEIDLSLDKLKQMYDIVLKLKAVPIVDAESKPMETDEILTSAPEPEIDKAITLQTEPETKETKAGDVLDLFNESQVSEGGPPLAEAGDGLIGKETIADKLQKSKLESIKSAIGINEKFFFLNELFSGDLKTYNDSIEKLDSLNTQEEAFTFLNKMAEEFNWNKESEALEQISQMLENKFS